MVGGHSVVMEGELPGRQRIVACIPPLRKAALMVRSSFRQTRDKTLRIDRRDDMNWRRGLIFRRLRLIAIAVAGLLASCAYPEIVSQTSEGLEIECAAGLTCRSSRQEIEEIAKDHCRKYGQNARQDSISASAMGK